MLTTYTKQRARQANLAPALTCYGYDQNHNI